MSEQAENEDALGAAEVRDPLVSLREKGYEVLTQFRLRCTERGCHHDLIVSPEAVGHYGVRYVEPHTGHVMAAEQRVLVTSEWVATEVDAVAAVLFDRHPVVTAKASA